jgi:nitrogen fixation NifU-like protein
MSELRRLYREAILDHGKRPRNQSSLADADHEAEGRNPLCGDHIALYIKSGGGRIEKIRFQGGGCLISVASASMMTEAVQGKSAAECGELIEAVAGLAGDGALPRELRALGGVRDFPVRIKCATLPWRTLRAALEDESGTVTTE